MNHSSPFTFSDEQEVSSDIIPNTLVIVGIAVAGGLCLFLFIIGVVYFWRKKRKFKSKERNVEEMRTSQARSNVTYSYHPSYRMSFQQSSPTTLVPFPGSETFLKIEEIPSNQSSEHFLDIFSIHQSWKLYFDKTKRLFEDGLKKRPHLTSAPLTVFQTLTRSNTQPSHPSAHLYALLFYVSDVFFGHFLKSNLVSDDRLQMYLYFIEQVSPSLSCFASATNESDDHNNPTALSVYSSLSSILQTEHRATFFQHWINSDVVLCIQDLCRLCWAYEVGITVEQTRQWVEEGICLFFKWKACIPNLAFYFPQLHSLTDPERMLLHTSAVVGQSKVVFTFWPGILDSDTGEVIQKARVWHTC